MRIGSTAYSTMANLCLILCVGSAIGFDRSSHWAWLVLGGLAGAVGITAYFVRHWQVRSTSEQQDPRALEEYAVAWETWARQLRDREVPRPAWSAAQTTQFYANLAEQLSEHSAEQLSEEFATTRAGLEFLRRQERWSRESFGIASTFRRIGTASAKAHPYVARSDPATLAARILRELHTGERGESLDVVIATDGTITLRVKDGTGFRAKDDAESTTRGFLVPAIEQSSRAVN